MISQWDFIFGLKTDFSETIGPFSSFTVATQQGFCFYYEEKEIELPSHPAIFYLELDYVVRESLADRSCIQHIVIMCSCR